MGQHNRNPTAIAAKKGEIPSKLSEFGAVEKRRRTQAKLREILTQRGLNLPYLFKGDY